METPESIKLRERAEYDLRSAISLKETDEELTPIICYHLQQYVEKMIKAKLLELGIPFKKTHDIGNLLRLIPDERLSKGFYEEADRLTAYCVNTRYDNLDPTIEETDRAFKVAEEIVKLLEKI